MNLGLDLWRKFEKLAENDDGPSQERARIAFPL
jgi:hypothetical protein